MDVYFVAKFLHILGAGILFGTGVGIAFFMAMAVRTKDAAFISRTAALVITADFVFTLSAITLQPITGIWLAVEQNMPVLQGWIVKSMGLYVLAGLFWIPMIFVQKKLHDMAVESAGSGAALPARFGRLYAVWLSLGGTVLTVLLGIFWLMITKP